MTLTVRSRSPWSQLLCELVIHDSELQLTPIKSAFHRLLWPRHLDSIKPLHVQYAAKLISLALNSLSHSFYTCHVICFCSWVTLTHNRFGDRSFSAAAGHRLWNDLPPRRRPDLSFPAFRQNLKTVRSKCIVTKFVCFLLNWPIDWLID